MSVRTLRLASLALILLAMAIVGYLVWTITDTYDAETRTARQTLTRTLTDRIELVVDRALFGVDSVAALLGASEQVTEAEFATFVQNIGLFGDPGAVRAVGLSTLSPADGWPALVRSLNERRADRAALGYPPEAPPEPAAGRTIMAPMLYAESPEGRAGIIGYDMASNPDRLAALLAARDRGETRMTAPVRLSQDPPASPPSVLIVRVLPARSSLAVDTGDAPAVVAVGLTPARLIGAVLGQSAGTLKTVPLVMVEDVSGPGDPKEIYRSPNLATGDAPFAEDRIPVLNRTWRVSFHAPPQGEHDRSIALVASLGGLAILVVAILGLAFDSNLRMRLTLEQRVVERTAELMHAARRAEAANVAKSEFLANMSHELRTPLNAIIGFAEMMADRIMGPVPEVYAEYPDLIRRSGRHLLETIDNVLDLAHIDAARLELERQSCSMRSLVEDVLDLLGRAGADKALALENRTDALHVLHVYPKRVKQALFNIIGNAVKFSDAGGNVVVRNQCGEGWHRLIVEDSGPGMSEAQITLALQPFGQVHGNAMVRRHGGAGLGLSLSAEIMRLHGGRLEIESRIGAGTRVTLAFPADADNPGHDETDRTDGGAPAPNGTDRR